MNPQMQGSGRQHGEVTLKLRSRLIRLAFLVRDREDLETAVRLYTHIWGGEGCALFPVPQSEEDDFYFRSALKAFDPDCIYCLEEFPVHVEDILRESPIPRLTKEAEKINDFLDRGWGMGLYGDLPHMARLPLRRHEPLEKGKVATIDLSGRYAAYSRVQVGYLSEKYAGYLADHHAMTVLPAPSDYEQYLRTCITLASRFTPAALTNLAIRPESSFLQSSPIGQESDSVALFLSSKDSIHAETAFWNTRSFSFQQHHYLLPVEDFRQNLSFTLSTLNKSYPTLKYLWVVAECSRSQAQEMQDMVLEEASRLGIELDVKVAYRDFKFDYLKETRYTHNEETLTRRINSDDSIRFNPRPLRYMESGRSSFAFDASMEFPSGRPYKLPRSPLLSKLLANSKKRLERAEKDPLALNPERFRPNANGIAGITTHGSESRVFIHPESMIISEMVGERGFSLAPSSPTRYARGFIRRFGGLDKSLRLVRDRGSEILKVLYGFEKRGSRQGMPFDHLKEQLSNRIGISASEAKSILDDVLPQLLEAGLVRRGYNLCCPECDLTSWYAIEDAAEKMRCHGCDLAFPFPMKSRRFAFRSNELAAQFIDSGGDAVLMAASTLRNLTRSNLLQLGGELSSERDSNYGIDQVEIDLLWATHELFAVGECKSFSIVDEERLNQLEEDARKAVRVAKALDCELVFIGVTASEKEEAIKEVVSEIAEEAHTEGISVHLILSGKLYLQGQQEPERSFRLSRSELSKDTRKSPIRPWYIGDFGATEIGRGARLDNELAETWFDELRN